MDRKSHIFYTMCAMFCTSRLLCDQPLLYSLLRPREGSPIRHQSVLNHNLTMPYVVDIRWDQKTANNPHPGRCGMHLAL
jgi:hypothetical protein